jgi:hypothetical protein
MERNFETVMIEQCAPVLAGLKPAGLFRYETRDCVDLAARVHRWNDQLGKKGLKVRVLKGCAQTHRYLIYVYRESRLRQVLADEAVQEFLQREGYALPEDLVEFHLSRTETMGAFIPSSAVDYNEGRPVEYTAIWGDPLSKARQAGASVPEWELLDKAIRKRLNIN